MPECALGEKIGGKRTVVMGKIRYVNKGSAVILLSSFSLLTHLLPCSPTPYCPLPSHATRTVQTKPCRGRTNSLLVPITTQR